jgi:hypothetical protein
MDDKQLQAIFNEMSAKLELGDFNMFKNQMSADPKFRKAFFTEASKDLELGDYNTFDSSFKKKDGTKTSAASPSPSPFSFQDLSNLSRNRPVADSKPVTAAVETKVKAQDFAQQGKPMIAVADKHKQDLDAAKKKVQSTIETGDQTFARLIREERLNIFDQQRSTTPQLDGMVNPAAETAKRETLMKSIVTPEEVSTKKQQAFADDKLAREVIKRNAKKDPELAKSAYLIDAEQRTIQDPTKTAIILQNADRIAKGELTYDVKKGILQKPEGALTSAINGLKDRNKQMEDFDFLANTMNDDAIIAQLEDDRRSFDPDKPMSVPDGAIAEFGQMLGSEGIAISKGAGAAVITGAIPGAQAAIPYVAAFASTPEYYKRSFATAFRQTYNELREKGVDERQALATARKQAEVEGNYGAAEGFVSGAVGARIGLRPIATTGMKNAIKTALVNSKNFVRENVVDGLVDGTIAGGLQIAKNVEAIRNGLDRNITDGVPENFGGEVTFSVGMGLLTKTGRRFIDENTYKTLINGFARQPKDLVDAKIGEMIVTGRMTPGEAVNIGKSIEAERSVDAQIPGTVNDETKRFEISSKIKERDALKQELTTSNEVFHSGIKEKIATIDKEIIDIQNKPIVVPGKRLFNEPNPDAAILETKYKEQKGIDTLDPVPVTKLDENKSMRIADEYEALEDSPNDPEVQTAYEALANETLDQFKIIADAGVKVELWDGEGEPYRNSEELIKDVRDNKHMYVFSTEDGFGDNPITDEKRSQNALLRDSGMKDANGKKLLMNDIFRFVHDYFGHTRLGNSFGAIGEENAWNVHARMYSPLARRAMTTETRGQNSWVNFNKSLRNADGTIKKKGDPGYIPPAQRPFADQKMGLLPEEFSIIEYDNLNDGVSEVASQNKIQSALDSSIDKATRSLQKTNIQFEVVDGSVGESTAARGNQAIFVSDEGKVIIDKSKLQDEVEAGLVVWHEASHPVMNIIRNTNKPLYDNVVKGLQEAAKQNEGVAASLSWAQSQPQYDNVDTQNDEAIVETIGRINSGLIDISKLDTGIRQSLIDFVNNIAKFFGIDPILNDTDIASFKKTVGQVADALMQGRDIAEVVGNQNVKEYMNKVEAPEVVGAGDINIQARVGNGIDVYQSKDVAPLPKRSLEDVYNTYNGKAVVINSDPTRVGSLSLPSGKNIFMYGGPGYLSIKDNVESNVGFATTQISKINTWMKYVNEVFGENAGVTLVATQAPTSILSNSYALRYVMDAISMLPKSVLRSSDFKSEFFGKDLVLLKDAFGEKSYNEFVSKYKKADLSNPLVIDGMISEMAYKIGDDNKPASFKARGAFVSNLLGGIEQKAKLKTVQGDQGYVSKKPTKYISSQLFNRLGVNAEKVIREIGEPSLVDLYMDEGKWGMAVSGFETDPNASVATAQSGGVKHPLFNAKFPGKNPFVLDGAYEVNKMFKPIEMTGPKGGAYTKTAAQMLAGSMYVKGQSSSAEGSFEYKTAPASASAIQSSVGNRGELLAPNGKPSNLNDVQYAQVRTPEFKNWFGDWENDPANASKVVDENGEPRVVYHGTNNTFDEFKKEKLGSKNWMADSAFMGFFFAGDRKTSEAYTGMNSLDMAGVSFGQYDDIINKYKPEIDKAQNDINEVYNRIRREESERRNTDMRSELEKNRKTLLDSGLSNETISEFFKSVIDSRVDYQSINTLAEKELEEGGYRDRLEAVNKKVYAEINDAWRKKTGANPQVMELFLNIKNPLVVDYKDVTETNLPGNIQKAIGTGKDGVIFNNLKDGAEADDIFVALEPNQIKSATDNVGTFSTEDNRIQASVGNRDIINWEKLKPGKGDPKISSRNPIVTKAAADLKDGKITNEEYRAVASENNPIRPITRFFEPATKSEVYNALSSDKLDKIDRSIEDGSPVGIRLDIPAFKNNNTWVVSVHEGSTNAGKAISYSNVARITDVTFGLEPKAGLKIAAGDSKSTIGRVFGKWQNLDGANMEDRGEAAKQIIQDTVGNPDWVQVGFNPFRHSYFYDRSSDMGRPIVSADEVVQIGGLVYAKKPVYGDWTDESYRVKGLFDKAGSPVQFSVGNRGDIYNKELPDGVINSIRTSLRRKAPDSTTLQYLDDLQAAKKNDALLPDGPVSDMLENGVTLNDISNMLLEDEVFEDEAQVRNYFNNIGGIDGSGIGPVMMSAGNRSEDDLRAEGAGEERERALASKFGELSAETQAKIEDDAAVYFQRPNKQTEKAVEEFIEGRNLMDMAEYVLGNPQIPEVSRVWMAATVAKRMNAEIDAAKAADDQPLVDALTKKQASIYNEFAKQATSLGQAVQAFIAFKGDPNAVEFFYPKIARQLKNKGVENITDEQKADIISMLKDVNSASPGIPKDKAIIKLSHYLGKMAPMKPMEVLQALWYAKILSGVTTQATNFFANVFNTFFELPAVGMRLAIKSGNPMAVLYGLKGLGSGIAKGAITGADMLKSGVRSKEADKLFAENTLEYFTWSNWLGEKGKVLDKIPPLNFGAWKYVGRLLAATDALFSTANKEAVANMLAYAQSQDPANKDFRSVNQILGNTKETITDAKAQAKAEGLVPGTIQYKRRLFEIISDKRGAEISDEADAIGKRITMNYDPEGWTKPLFDGVVGLQQSIPAIKMVIPFARIVANLTENALNYSPAGFVRAATGIRNPFNSKNKHLTTEERIDIMSKFAIGMGALAIMATKAGDDEEDWFEITAGGSNDPQKKYELQKGGWRPYTITFKDGTKLSYKDWPIAGVLAGIGHMRDAKKYSFDDSTQMGLYATGFFLNFYDKSLLSGLSDFFGIFDVKAGRGKYAPETKASERASKYAAQQVRSVALSNLAQQTGKLYSELVSGDPQRDAKTFMEVIYRDIPVINDGIRPIIDVFGDPVKYNTTERLTPVSSPEKDKLIEWLNENKFFVGVVPKRNIFDMDSMTERPMTDDEYYEYKKLAGRKSKEWIMNMMTLIENDNRQISEKAFEAGKKAARDLAYVELLMNTK